MYRFVPVAGFAIAVVITYYRYREHFSDLAFATDSRRSGFFWTVVAVAYAVIACRSVGRVLTRSHLIMKRRGKLPTPSGAKARVFIGSGRHG
jgi:hypothetical protein